MSGPVAPTGDQMAKLRSELDIVNGNICVMGDMLTEMVPGEEDPADLELLHELNRTCRAMQTRLLELIEKISVEEVIEELLHVNDDLNNVFLRFERFERYRTGKTAAAAPANNAAVAAPTSAVTPTPAHTSPNRDPVSLIDLSSNPAPSVAADAEEDVARQLASLGIVDAAAGSGVAATATSTSSGATADASTEDEFKEMEAWLGATGGESGGAAAAAGGGGGAGVSSSEFDDFLASRLGATSSTTFGDSASGNDASLLGGASSSSSGAIRSIGDVPSISASSGAVPRVNRTTKNDDQDLLLG